MQDLWGVGRREHEGSTVYLGLSWKGTGGRQDTGTCKISGNLSKVGTMRRIQYTWGIKLGVYCVGRKR